MAELARLLAVTPERLREYLEDAEAIVLPNGAVIDSIAGRDLECEVPALVEEHHRNHPTEPGLPRDRLGKNAGAVDRQADRSRRVAERAGAAPASQLRPGRTSVES